jgi:hypothetical protein
MSYNEFKPTYWSDKVFSQYANNLVMLPLTNREYESEITSSGQRIKINELGDVTTKDYVEGTDLVYETISDASKFLDIDQKNYTAITLEDVDNAQSKPKIIGSLAERMGISMADTVDAYLLNQAYTDAGTIVTGTEGSPTSITSANIITYMNTTAVQMDDANVPKQNRVCVLPNWMAGKITLAQINKSTDNVKALQAGYLGDFLGFSVYQSNNVVKSGTDWSAPVFFRANDSIAFASQIIKSEAMKAEKKFAELVRMLNVYGVKTVRPSSLFSMRVTEGAES